MGAHDVKNYNQMLCIKCIKKVILNTFTNIKNK